MASVSGLGRIRYLDALLRSCPSVFAGLRRCQGTRGGACRAAPVRQLLRGGLQAADACDSLAVPGVSLLLCLLRGLICMRQIRVVMNDCKNCKKPPGPFRLADYTTHVRAPN